MRAAVVIDQRLIRAKGGVCAKSPVSCIVRDLLAAAGVLQPFHRLRVLDLTYGEGRFWLALPQAEVTGFDIAKLKWVRRPQRFFNRSATAWRELVSNEHFDLVVVDPPFPLHYRERDDRHHYLSLTKCPYYLINEGMKAAIYFEAPLLIHFLFKIEHPDFEVLEEAWFQPYFINAKNYYSWFGVLRPVYLTGMR